ncbi:MAG: hypothetical protein WC822_06775 [Candidatus Paceibacterota bacterium]|jgi:hypothetical protein
MITVLHADDRLLVEELAGTTESEGQSGNVRYYTPVKDRDHRTDSLRACVRAIMSLTAEQTGYSEFKMEQETGWIDLGDGDNAGFSWEPSF